MFLECSLFILSDVPLGAVSGEPDARVPRVSSGHQVPGDHGHASAGTGGGRRPRQARAGPRPGDGGSLLPFTVLIALQ